MIIHDEAHCRFLQEDPKGTAYMEYTCAGNILTVTHTKVPDALAGRGIAGKLASASMNGPSAITTSSTPNALT